MKIQLENLRAHLEGRELNTQQKLQALVEFSKLLDYVIELQQLIVSDGLNKKELLISYCEYILDECTDQDKQTIDEFLKTKKIRNYE